MKRLLRRPRDRHQRDAGPRPRALHGVVSALAWRRIRCEAAPDRAPAGASRKVNEDMANPDAIVIGGGISGLAFAWKAGQAGRRRRPGAGAAGRRLHPGGADAGRLLVRARRAHRVQQLRRVPRHRGRERRRAQNPRARSGAGALRAPRGRGRHVAHAAEDILLRLDWLEAALNAPVGLFRKKDGETMSSWYGRVVGRRNYGRVLAPFFAAVPSQSADGFPALGAGSLFKKRPAGRSSCGASGSTAACSSSARRRRARAASGSRPASR